MKIKNYDREKVLRYAKTWALKRNPKYYNFDSIGGDCTSFASQCIYAGSNTMNYKKDTGWYYNSIRDRAPAWSGVEFLYKFLVNNKGIGPFGKEVNINEIQIGDIVQLNFNGNNYGHTLVIVEIKEPNSLENIKIAAHTDDIYGKKISEYNYQKIRLIHIEGVRTW